MNIGPTSIGGDSPCRTVFELSCNHNGSLALAHRLIDAAKRADADFVKFQAYTPDELVALRGDGPAPAQWGEQGWMMRALYEKARTPLEWLPELFQHARDVGIVPFSSVFGKESYRALEDVECPAFKIARLDNSNHALWRRIEVSGRPMIVSADKTMPGPVTGVGGNLAWLYCPPGYPAEVRALPKFNGSNWIANDRDYLGLSSHCLDPRLPIAAVARGAKLLEYHVQLDDTPSALEANISLTVSEFKRMVADVRATEVMLG